MYNQVSVLGGGGEFTRYVDVGGRGVDRGGGPCPAAAARGEPWIR